MTPALAIVSAGSQMEAFEQFVALAMESEGLVVSSALNFNVRRTTLKVLEATQSPRPIEQGS